MAASLDVPVRQEDLSEAREAALSWGTSVLLHAGFGLLVLFGAYAVSRAREAETKEVIISPIGSGEELRVGPQEKLGRSEDLTAKAMQNVIRDVKDPGADPYGLAGGDLSRFTSMKGDQPLDAITFGPGGGFATGGTSLREGSGDGRLAAFGPRTQDGGGSIFGVPCRLATRPATKIVLLLDHSGSMIDTFDFLRQEVKRSVTLMLPHQQFSVIMFSEDVDVLGPNELRRAHPDVKRDVLDRLDRVRAAGRNDDLLEPFQKGFETAFAMKPNVIIFLTDGKFDERLPGVVGKLNKDKAVHVNTIAFVRIEKRSEEQLREIAADNNGKYKFVSEADLGK